VKLNGFEGKIKMELNFQLKLGIWGESSQDDKTEILWKEFCATRNALIRHLEFLSVYPVSQLSQYLIDQGALE
jgi:hypothetical protein